MPRNLTEYRRVQAAMAVQAELATIFLTAAGDDLFHEVLTVVLEVMRSPLGLFGFIDEAGALVVPAMTRQVWDQCQVADKRFVFPRETWGDSSWPRAIREKRANYSNELSAKTPKGHLRLERHISLPILFQGEVIGLFQVANRESDYTEADLDTLQAMAGQIAPLLKSRMMRERSEAALRTSEQEFRTLAEAVPQIVWATRPDGWNIYFNRQWVDYTGLTLEESYGHGWNKPFHPDDQKRAWDAWQRATRDNATYSLECRLRRADGAYRWWLIRGVPLRDARGTIQKWFGTCTDIEDFKQAQTALEESERRLREAQELAQLGRWSWNLKTGQVEWSEEVYRIFRLDPEKFIPHVDSILALSPWPGDRERDLGLIRRAVASHEKGTYEQRFLRPDGSTGHYHVTFHGNYDEAGEAVSIVGTIWDITERKQAEAALRESEELFRATFDQAAVGIAQVSPEGRWLRVNQKLCDVLGYSPQELLSMTFREITHPDDLEADLENKRRSLAGEIKWYSMEKRYLRKDGTPVWIHLTASLVRGGGGQPKYFISIIEDISERRRVEDQLRLSEERFSSAFRIGPAGMAITRAADGKFIDVNEPFLELFEFSREEVVGHTATELNVLIFEGPGKGNGRQPGPAGMRDVETVARSKSGRPISLLLSSQPIRLEGESCSVTTMIDITARKRAEEALRRSEAMYKTLVESIPQKIFMKNREFRWVAINEKFARDLGVRPEETVGKVDYDFFPKELADKYRADDDRIMRTGRTEELEESYVQDGMDVWVNTIKTPVRDENDNIIGLFGIFWDITARRRAEEALRTRTERLKNLHRIDQAILQASDSPEAISEETSSGVRELLHCQRVSVCMFDFERRKLRVVTATGTADPAAGEGQMPAEEPLGDLDDIQLRKLEIIEDISRLEAPPALAHATHAEGMRSFLNAPIISPRGLAGVLSIGWDRPRAISQEEQEIACEVASQLAIAFEQARLLQETKRHAEELEEKVRLRTAQLEAANQELEAFSYSVSHDLRAPLRHISGYVDLLRSRFREALPEKARHYLEEVADSVRLMGILIDDLLQFSRTGRQELRQADVDMSAAVREVLERLKADTKARNICWTVPELPRVFGDDSLLKQVWTNLLDNAVKYTQYKENAEIEIGFTREPDHWVFFVRDNGVGFDMQYAHRLFRVFQRLHSAAQFAGTGIGLANVQRVIQRHGGRVWAEARPDEGATFYFAIPATTPGEGGRG